MKDFRSILFATAAAMLVSAVGCGHSSQPADPRGEVILPDSEPRAVQNISAAEAVAGARADATLRPFHFDDDGLNSLGREKLGLMLGGEEPPHRLTVYLDFPHESKTDIAKTAIAEYLAARGLDGSRITIVEGPNPNTLRSAADVMTAEEAMKDNQPGGTASVQAGMPASNAAPTSSGAAASPGASQ